MSPTRSPIFLVVLLVLCALVVPVSAQNADTHVIQPGENLFRIAQQYGLSMAELAAANEISNASVVYAGQTLVIPSQDTSPNVEVEIAELPEGDAAPAEIEPEIVTQPLYHTIQPGEMLSSIAGQYGMSEVDLIVQNGIINPDRILVGQQLIVGERVVGPEVELAADPAAPATEAELAALVPDLQGAVDAMGDNTASIEDVQTITHIVQPGQYLSSIARQYNVSPQALMAMNNIANPDIVSAGQALLIPSDVTQEEMEAIIYAPPTAAVGTGREIVVDLSNSRAYAYEDGILMYEAVSSNGLPATPTVQGSFTVRTKVRSQTMSGPGYWLPNVEYVMYFYSGYALHGAYWHNNWGQPMSHGCVNLRNTDAKWFYDFAEVGTPVTVQF